MKAKKLPNSAIVKALFLAIIGALKPPDRTPTAQWVDQHIKFSRKVPTPWPGPFRIARTPYIKGVFDAYDARNIEQIVLVWGRQTAKSTTIYCCMLRSMDQDPGPMIFNVPSIELGAYTSRNRLQPIINSCDVVRAKKTGNRNDFTVLEMRLEDMVLSLVGSGSDVQAMSRPARYLFRDEIDEIGKDVLGIIFETTSSFSNKKIVDTSTTTSVQGNVWQGLITSQYVFELWVPCPECKTYQTLTFDQIKFGDERDPEKVRETAYYECRECKAEIRDGEKLPMLSAGQWRARQTNDPCAEIMKGITPAYKSTVELYDVLYDRKTKKIGFYLPKWYAPMSGASFGQAAKDFLEASQFKKMTGDTTLLQNWTKFWKSIPWLEAVDMKEADELMRNKIELAPVVCPSDTLALTCGVDPGQGGFWYVVVSWSKTFSPHLVQHGFLLDYDSVRRLWLENVYAVKGLSYPIKIWRKGMDTGGSKYGDESETMTGAAYEFIRTCDDGFTFGTKGQETLKAGGNMTLKRIDTMPGPNGKPIPGGLPIWFIRPSYFKNLTHMRLNVREGDPGRFTFNDGIDAGSDYIKHLRGEEKRRDPKTGKWEWIATGPNHLLDATVIAFSLADPECFGGVRVLEPLPKEDIPEEAMEEEDKTESDWINGGKPKKGGWI